MATSEAARPLDLVFLLHGILLNRWFCAPMSAHLTRRGFRVVNLSYPSTRRTIEEHARSLDGIVRAETDRLRDAGTPFQVHFVGHSLGGLVVRYLLSHYQVPNAARCVLLVTPNNGSSKARRFRRNVLYRLVFGGHSGAQLASEPPGIFEQCGIPQGVEMGILAGVAGSILTVPTRSLRGEHDGVLTLDEVRLPGVTCKTCRYGHTTILFRRGAMEEVAHFLQHGRFIPEPGSETAAPP